VQGSQQARGLAGTMGAIYIGRGSKWGNPFRIGVDGNRATVIAKYARWLRRQHHLLRARRAAWEGSSAVLLRTGGMPWRSAATARECDPRRAYRLVAPGGVIAAHRRRLAQAYRPIPGRPPYGRCPRLRGRAWPGRP
jgi:hypothetical protein